MDVNEYFGKMMQGDDVTGVSKDGSDPTKVTGYEYCTLGAIEATVLASTMAGIVGKASDTNISEKDAIMASPMLVLFRSQDKVTGKPVTLLCVSMSGDTPGTRKSIPVAAMFSDPNLAMTAYEAPKGKALVGTLGAFVDGDSKEAKEAQTASAEEVGNVFAGLSGGSKKYFH